MKKKSIGEKIKELRKSQDLTQLQLGMLSGVHAISIFRIENGKVKPNEPTLRCLASALGTTLEKLKGE